MTSNSYTRQSYLDGVPFAINPIFITNNNDKEVDNTDRTNYDLTKAFSMLNFKYEFLSETKVIKSKEKSRKKRKENVDKKQSFVANLGNEAEFISSSTGSLSSLVNDKKKSNSLSITEETQSSYLSMNQPIPNHDYTNNPNFYSQTISSNQKLNDNLNLPQRPSSSTSSILLATSPNYSTLLQPARQTIDQNLEKNSNQTELNNLKNRHDKKELVIDMFFNDTLSSDPFSDMELKTINDLEELKNILHQQQQDQNKLQKQNLEENTHSKSILSQNLTSSETNSDLLLTKLQQLKLQNTIQNSVNNSNINSASNDRSKTIFAVDSFGLPKISFVDLDINSNNL